MILPLNPLTLSSREASARDLASRSRWTLGRAAIRWSLNALKTRPPSSNTKDPLTVEEQNPDPGSLSGMTSSLHL